MRRLQLEGKQINDWKVLDFLGRKNGKPYYTCQCSCGRFETVDGYNLSSGQSKRCKDCGRGRTTAALYGKDRSKYSAGEMSYRRYWQDYSRRAKKKGQIFKLSREEFRRLSTSNCVYCGIEPSLKYNGTDAGRKNSLEVRQERFDAGWILVTGVDRVDSSKGYSMDNCVPCCEMCNKAKRDKSVEYFLEWAIKLAKFQNKKP